MKWDQEIALEALKPLLWRYVSASAKLVRRVGIPAEVDISDPELRRLAALHMTVRIDRDGILDTAARLVRAMPASVQRRSEVLHGYVHGRIDWRRTIQARITSGDPFDPTLFSCESIARRYDTDLGRLVKACLSSIGQLGNLAGLPVTTSDSLETLGEITRRVSRQALALAQDVKLRSVRHVDASTLRHVPELVGRYPELRPLVEVLHDYIRVFRAQERPLLADVVGPEIFRPNADSKIFELQVAVEAMRSLEDEGFDLIGPVSLLPNSASPLGSFRRGELDVHLWWQRNAWDVIGVRGVKGTWGKLLRANQLSVDPLLPDLILHAPSKRRLLVIEVKLTQSDRGIATEREGLRDLLAYSADLQGCWGGTVQYLAVGWNAAGSWNSREQKFLVSPQDRIRSTIGNIVESWASEDEN
jgi:hypothetical protein